MIILTERFAMKKNLAFVICCILCASFTVNAMEYTEKDTIDCSQDEIVMRCDLKGKPITGVFAWHYENGNLKGEGNYKGGKPEGLQKMYYRNGNLEAEENYKDGRLEGWAREYYEDGTLSGEVNFKDGKQEGLARTYFENGNLETEINLKDGKIEGLAKYYYKNGNLYAEVNYRNNKAIFGFVYDINGEKAKIDNTSLYKITEHLKVR